MSFQLMGAFNCNLMACIARHEGIHPMSDASPIATRIEFFIAYGNDATLECN